MFMSSWLYFIFQILAYNVALYLKDLQELLSLILQAYYVVRHQSNSRGYPRGRLGKIGLPKLLHLSPVLYSSGEVDSSYIIKQIGLGEINFLLHM